MSTFKDMNRFVEVAMLQLANMNHRLLKLDDEVQARQGMGIGFLAQPWLTADRMLHFSFT